MYLPLLRILYLTYVYTSLTPYSKTNVEKFCHDREITLKLSCNHVIKFMDDKIKPVTILNLVISLVYYIPTNCQQWNILVQHILEDVSKTFCTFYLFLNIQTNVLSFFCFRLGPLTVFLDVLFLKFWERWFKQRDEGEDNGQVSPSRSSKNFTTL